jgi:formylglycine-generating enzyme required for sulfatase activity
MARFAVTVSQFRAFVDATNYKSIDPDALRDADNRPVRYVSWQEAKDYCTWLTSALAQAPDLQGHAAVALIRDGGWSVDLPNEPEWEKAARGGLVGEVFSWAFRRNPQRANVNESRIDDTCTVGCFPANAYGLHDMLGNVWEWTRSRWAGYPYPVNDSEREPGRGGSKDLWVVRGGAWNFDSDFARCATRLRNLADDRHGSLGFRVVLRSSPV